MTIKKVQLLHNKIIELEGVLYDILNSNRLDDIKELAADALGEDLDIYLEEDIYEEEELDFYD